MDRNMRRGHDTEFKSKIALETLKGILPFLITAILINPSPRSKHGAEFIAICDPYTQKVFRGNNLSIMKSGM